MASGPPLSPAPKDPVTDRVLSSYLAAGSPGQVLCAFSGGADSTALLLALAEVRRDFPFRLRAVHVNHGLRPAADRDERFCRQVCASLDIPLTVRRLALSGTGEEEAREERYRVLFGEAARFGPCVIALAHHARDQAETVLMRLMRGTVSGIGAMQVLSPPSGDRPALWRPLLPLPPEDLRACLRARGQSWVEDETNRDKRYLRNLIRLEVLPPMEKRMPSAVKHIAASASVLGEESRFLDGMAQALLEGNARTVSPCACIRAGVLSDAPKVLRRRCIHLFLARWRRCEMPGMEMICRLADLSPGQSVSIGNGCRASRTDAYLHFLPPDDPPPVPEAFRTAPAPEGVRGDGLRTQAVPARLLPRIRLRAASAGDRIVPFGMKSEKPLTDFLSARGIEPLFRRHHPVLCLEGRILWVPGAGPGEDARVLPGEDALLLSWPGWLPGDMDEPGRTIKQNGGNTR